MSNIIKYSIIILLIIIFLPKILFWCKDYFYNCNQKIIALYTPTSYFGLGDYIRGIINLYQNENEEKIFISYNTNDISKYLNNEYNNNYEHKLIAFASDVHIINFTNETNYSSIKNFNFHEKLLLCHNAAINYPIDKNILNKVKKMFTPNPDFQKLIHQSIYDLTMNKPFIVLHLRLLDDVFLNDRILSDLTIDKIIKDLQLENDYEIIIMSNSIKTKNYYCQQYNVKCSNIIPTHTGAIGVKGDIKDTLLEFFIMSKASSIYQYCEDVLQKSGFSQRISEIFEIPLIVIKH